MSDSYPDKHPVQRLIVVGGGTAGWLTALTWRAYLNTQIGTSSRTSTVASTQTPPIDITVVESSSIPTIGVGEGTTAVFSTLLQTLGIDEAEFLCQTGATIKYGIKHRDWRHIGHEYDGPIDDPHVLTDYSNAVPWLDIAAIAAGKPLSHHHLFHYLLNLNKAPFALSASGKATALGPFHYAYHFDQAKVGAYLRTKASGINHVDAQVQDIERDNDSNITALLTTDGQRFEADFFIDCTGFKRALIGKLQQDNWVSYQSNLPVNRAMPFWLKHDSSGALPPYTLSWAQRNGWMWAIPTQERMGMGYVYSDEFTTPDEAQAEIEQVLGQRIEPRNDLKFDSGRLKHCWVNNCIALGLSSSFLEPLEATSIHATVVQLLLLLQRHLDRNNEGFALCGQSAYNDFVASQVDDFRDFINLHYVSERDDSPFWQHVSSQCISELNRERIKRWHQSPPLRSDFKRLPLSLPHTEEQLYYPVLNGLGLLDKASAKKLLDSSPEHRKRARSDLKSLTAEYRIASTRAADHSLYLAGLSVTNPG